tara:strand:+ start:5149 stop:5517 length:369 start_codon:yes stop_codon:yes gene_type:complete
MAKLPIEFHTLKEHARRIEVTGMLWLNIAKQGYVMPHQWATASTYASDPSTCPFNLPELQHHLHYMQTTDDWVNVSFKTQSAKQACKWLAQTAYEERNSRFMEQLYHIFAMTEIKHNKQNKN